MYAHAHKIKHIEMNRHSNKLMIAPTYRHMPSGKYRDILLHTCIP